MPEAMPGLKALGKKTENIFTYNPAYLESIPNRHRDNDYTVSLEAIEFTSLCPVTGQPDFGKIIINYIPNALLVESKSLKLYLGSFRNSGEFGEDCVNIIHNDLKKLLSPKYIEVLGCFAPRGGIAIKPFVNSAERKFSGFAEERKKDVMSKVTGER